MANKASPDELAMHASAEKAELTFNELAAQMEAGKPAVDNTASGDHDKDTVTPRKRGRPRKSETESTLEAALKAEDPGAATAPESGTSKPGRKPSKKAVPSGEALGRQLVGIHTLAAMVLQIPELQLREDEGKSLGDAVVNICEEYNLAISGKTGAAIQLIAAMAMVYTPRLVMFKIRMAQQQAQTQPQGGTENVHVLHPGPN